MLYLESFVHRVKLAEIISRWMVNQPRPGDLRQIKTIVNFNSYISRVWLDHLAGEILRKLYGLDPKRTVIRMKGVVKDFVVSHPTYTNARIEEMRSRYRRFPEDFYRETPIDGAFYTVDVGNDPRLVATTRIKHFRRIAEKGSRRIVDYIFGRIRANADALAEERARNLGIPKSQLVTSPAEMAEEFAHAERRVIKSIKKGTIQSELPILAIPDVAGAKIIAESSEYNRLLESLCASGSCQLLEEEVHTGHYNAVNLRVAYNLPRALLAATPPTGSYLRVLAHRGFDPDTIPFLYRDFLDQAEDHVMVEVIVSNFQEYLESELGRCMHEERVLSQRSHPEYNGHLATNVRYLMDFILGLCRGTSMADIGEVPIKLWVKYMPDMHEHLMRSFYLPDDVFFDTLPEPPGVESRAAPTRALA